MIKYYKTPDVIATDDCGNAYCTNGVIILDTSLMSEESNRAALRLVNALRFVKCSKIEAEDHQVATPMGIVEYTAMKVVNCPEEVVETQLGKFVIDGTTTIDTNVDCGLLGQLLYCE